MASSMITSTSAVVARSSPAQSSLVGPFTGLKSAAAFPGTKKSNDITSIATNGGRVQCMKVWPTVGLKKFETLSYLPPLTEAQLAKEIDYLLRSKWIPCIEFELEHGFVYREHHASPGYYDGRYWTMWKLPMFGCTDSTQVLAELNEVKTAHPNAFVRIIGFDNVRQVQCISFIAYKPAGY
ncbi:ribulose bisphosphate carboxylase small chain chloroplastic [Phtheirospermum japonicum]|uniref:Ribulose bisphosphate carboxylase small subunit, chloroplastic n=1 Tax=Phtheirospermum japonicum TaxID=374723 RepID=A0A830BCG0_9LAMI|nr:ribulose bisphosphate carboxylase small chain chloroplastic [Phtheirospermum japonicum]